MGIIIGQLFEIMLVFFRISKNKKLPKFLVVMHVLLIQREFIETTFGRE
jgi:hypothetical protein